MIIIIIINQNVILETERGNKKTKKQKIKKCRQRNNEAVRPSYT